ncbi:lytic transglycosylase domain-containing protein [Helicobacter sp.]|uniref:lytic transglycosylase domain-containing protein n=1 Tax=Helicobacter sp. TaxID=218 RepID=UPI0025C680B2|nr:lytic transglycosylase domain-containing protein [Helicobacter sp.]MCI5968517.1 lytic transglycosylase domain-containing protein [Helicobacter sp.]MDY2584726.1 lytic transglycosylase domain-containing protein [Helicobacter sp.]
MKKLVFFLCCVSFTFANTQPTKTQEITLNQNITLDYLKKQPAGISRDFYIWLFLQQDITPKEAKEAYDLAMRKNPKLFGLYFKKGDNKTLSRKTICEQMPLNNLLKEDAQCIALGLTTKKAESLDKKTLKKLSDSVKPHNLKLSKELQILASKNPFETLIAQDAKTFGSFYFSVSQNYRNHLNIKIPQDTIIRLINENDGNFNRALKHMILSPNLKTFNASLTTIKSQSIINRLDAETSFYLGLNAMHYDKKEQALSYFLHSQKLSKHSFNKNRSTFWAFLASNDELYLQELTQSKSVDVYSLASLEMLEKHPNYNIVYDIPIKAKNANWDFKNPFEWERIRDSFKALKTSNEYSAKKLLLKTHSAETEAHYVWLSRDFSKEYFLMPYKEVFSNFSNDKQALLYALARQESLFIPTAISTSYALGLMQLMPFNVKAIAKELKQEHKISYLDMFDPAINVPYAEYFTRPLIKEFNHPLFISYAYNGGPGFTRRLLAKNYLFKKNNPLDPWYSMEMIPYEESRIYGKKVLANYVIYQRKLGKEVNVLDLLRETLVY